MKTKDLTKASLLTAVSVILVYLSSVIPYNKLAILTVASLAVPIDMIVSNLKAAALVYTAVSILSFIILGFQTSSILYFIFFGLYGLIKFLIERKRNLKIEIPLKLIFFNISALVIYSILKFVLNINVLSMFSSTVPIVIIIAASEVGFLIYDYALTILIFFLSKRLKNF